MAWNNLNKARVELAAKEKKRRLKEKRRRLRRL
jgi:hypothetical protein